LALLAAAPAVVAELVVVAELAPAGPARARRLQLAARAGRYRGRGLRLAARDRNRGSAHHANSDGPSARADEEVAARRERLEPFA